MIGDASGPCRVRRPSPIGGHDLAGARWRRTGRTPPIGGPDPAGKHEHDQEHAPTSSLPLPRPDLRRGAGQVRRIGLSQTGEAVLSLLWTVSVPVWRNV